MRLPSPPWTTIARADSLLSTPYEGFLIVDCWLGSVNGWLGSRSCAYWPAEAPTCHEASTTAAPAFTWPLEPSPVVVPPPAPTADVSVLPVSAPCPNARSLAMAAHCGYASRY